MKIPGLLVPVTGQPPLPQEQAAVLVKNAHNSLNSLTLTQSAQSRKLNGAAQLSGQGAAFFKTLGLPADRLSASIVSFAQFFSLPLEPALLTKVRRSAVSGQGDGSGNGRPAAQADARAAVENSRREALSLAALAAGDKGLELTTAGLAEYAAAIDPDRQGGHHADRRDSRDGEKKQRRQDREGGDDGELPLTDSAALSASALKTELTGAADAIPLLALLNRLPGRNGRRWLTFPLDFAEDGFRYRVSLRILLESAVDESPLPEMPAGLPPRMGLDIVKTRDIPESGGGVSERWVFVFDREPLRAASPYRLTVISPPGGNAKLLAKKISRFMELPLERVTVKNSADSDFAADCRVDVLHSVDEEV